MGNGINSTSQPLYVLWTVCTYEGMTSSGVDINHFVPLIERPLTAEIVTLTDSATDPPETSAMHCDDSKPAKPVAPPSDTATAFVDVDIDASVDDACPSELVNNSPHAAGNSSDNFMSFTECVQIMESCAQTVPEIPDGPKNNVNFLVDQTRNMEREATGKRRAFRDDCGVWESVRSRTVYLEKTVLPAGRFEKRGVLCS